MLISSKGRSLSSLKIGREGYFWAHQIDPNCLVERFTQLCKMICPHVICFNLRYSTIASFIIYSSHPSSPSIDLNGKPRHSFCSSLVPRNSRRKGKAKEHVHNLGVERQKIKEQASEQYYAKKLLAISIMKLCLLVSPLTSSPATKKSDHQILLKKCIMPMNIYVEKILNE